MARSARSAISRETGLLKSWPAAGPPRAWSASDLGAGFGSIAVSRDRIFVLGMRDSRSVVSALNRADGKLVWSRRSSAGPWTTTAGPDRAARRRWTATALRLTENGDLACLRVQDGASSGGGTSCRISAAATSAG